MISEIAYYCDEAGAEDLGRRAAASLTDDGVLLLCHWLHPVADYPLSGDLAQRLVGEASGLRRLVGHEEDDFRLELLARPTLRVGRGRRRSPRRLGRVAVRPRKQGILASP